MDLWKVLHTICLVFIEVLRYWSEVWACVESSGALTMGSVWPGNTSTFGWVCGHSPQGQLGACTGVKDRVQRAVGRQSSILSLPSFLGVCVFFQVLSAMARRPRSSRAWHFVLSAARRDADARVVALAGTANWGYDSDGQVGPREEGVLLD